jgi:uncharacterized protein YfdQ (DUF2303 family)
MGIEDKKSLSATAGLAEGSLRDVEAAVCAGASAVDIESRFRVLDLGNGSRAVVAIGNEGRPVVLDELDQALREAALGPTRRTGMVMLHEVDSFIEHVRRFALPDQTTLWADARDFSLQAVFDDDPAGPTLTAAGWRAHRAKYTCPRSPEWLAWTGMEGKELRQEPFAQFLEDRLEDIASKEGFPRAADLLEMARNLTINVKGTFKKTINPHDGTGTLTADVEHGGGSTKIPRAFMLGLRVFEGGAPYEVEARIRFAMREGTPSFGFILHRRAEIERDAFNDVRAQVAKGVGLSVFAGTPGA